jgi:hypothetical protein
MFSSDETQVNQNHSKSISAELVWKRRFRSLSSNQKKAVHHVGSIKAASILTASDLSSTTTVY